jgi:hypothetical protein
MSDISTTPGMEENSWRTPVILTAVMAAPLIEDSKTRAVSCQR